MVRVPEKLTKNGIYNVMKTFGNVTEVFIPKNRYLSSGRMMAFVEYKTFSEAEKALRELNSISNTGLKIEAEFANLRNRDKKCDSPELAVSPSIETNDQSVNHDNNNDRNFEKVEDQPKVFIKVNFHEYNNDDKFEKMTNFEYKKPALTKMQLKAQNELKEQALNSMGTYDPKKNIFIYNEELRNKIFLVFYCNVCENRSKFKREINGKKKYFCSLECFKNFQGNKISDVSDTEKEEEEVSLKKSDKVFITAIMNEKCLYVRSINDDLIPLFDEVYEAGNKMEMYEGIAEIDEHLLVRKFDEIFRAIVLEKSEVVDENGWPEYIVRLTDIGNTLRVKQEELLMYPAKCLKLKISTFKITLKDVNVEAINMNVVDYLMNLLENKTELIIKNIDDDGVELKDNTDNTNVNQNIVSLANIENENLCIRSFPQNYMSAGQSKKMFVICAYYLELLGDIICIDSHYLKDFYELYKALNAYGNKIDIKSYGLMQLEETNLVKYNNQWHRAIVREKCGDGKPLCYFIDLQFQDNVNVENIFKLPKVFAETPVYTVACKIKYYDPEKNQCEKCNIFLRDLLQENEFIIADKVDYDEKNDQHILIFNSYENFVVDHHC
ncbi:hypothetical protein PVAND_010234 [Polypedilum vanderplanki]|uniref:RRM domain-containing protein n=1 Tax=Polypedilum vanderplanki TaxID=319348 RepID=A0A9J6CEY2_POLVA|nr:hypothetical protein PVAND_010234 [Polypedilum vanderplanki]